MNSRIFPCSLALLAGTLITFPGHAGTVSGAVSGDTQHPATITLTAEGAGNQVYRVKTNQAGGYSIFLPVGSYTVKVGGKSCGKINSFDVPVRRDIKCP
jgi:hypothetical protein